MKKIAIFIGGYLPAKNYGGPVTSIANLVDILGDEYEFWIVSNNHEYKEKKPLKDIKSGWNQVGKAKVIYLPESEFVYARFLEILKEINADVAYLSSVFYLPNLKFIKVAKKLNVAIVLAPRGELFDNAIRNGKTKKKLYISFLRFMKIYKGVVFHATMEEEMIKLQEYFHIKRDNIFVIPNMHGRLNQREVPDKKSGEMRLIYLARIHEHKNLQVAIKAVTKSKNRIVFDIYGPIEQEAYWKTCEELISTAPSNISIQYKGGLEPQEAKLKYMEYHCSILPTASENYGHSICESLLCGCPVIISKDTTPWNDVDHVVGYTVQLDSIDGFCEAIDTVCSMDANQYACLINRIPDYLDNKLETPKLLEKYRSMFRLAYSLWRI